MKRWAAAALVLASGAILLALLARRDPGAPRHVSPGITLTPCHVDGVKEELSCGVYNVFENRITRHGRMLPVKIILIPARSPRPEQGPIFYIAGGPGETVTEMAPFAIDSGDSGEHDVVLVDLSAEPAMGTGWIVVRRARTTIWKATSMVHSTRRPPAPAAMNWRGDMT